MLAHVLFAALAVQAAPPPLGATRATAVDPADAREPLRSLVALFSADDYPREAIAKREEGTVRARLTIDATGRLSACDIVQSSGSSSLDAATCQILRQRARFSPATDAAGRPVPDVMEQKIRWELPSADSRSFTENAQKTLLTFDKAGKLVACRNEPTLGSPYDQINCDGLGPVIALIDKDLRAGRTLVSESGLLIGGPDSAKGIGKRPGQSLVSRTELALSISADGEVVDCTLVDLSASSDEPDKDLPCRQAQLMSFEPLPADAADRSPRHAVDYTALYYVATAR